MHATSVSGYSLHYFLILHSQSRAQNKFGTFAGCVDRPKKLKLGHVSRLTGQNVKNNPITTWTCLVQMTSKRKVCLDKWSSWLDIVCWPAVMLSKINEEKKRSKVFLPSSIFSSLACLGSLRAAVQSFCVPSYRLIKWVGLELLVADVLQNSSTFFIHLREEIKAFFTKGYFFLDPQPAKRKKEMSL